MHSANMSQNNILIQPLKGVAIIETLHDPMWAECCSLPKTSNFMAAGIKCHVLGIARLCCTSTSNVSIMGPDSPECSCMTYVESHLTALSYALQGHTVQL